MKTLLAFLTFYFITPFVFAENLIIGTSTFDPPMEMLATQSGVFTGFEVDLVNEVCRRIKATCVFKPMKFKEIMSSALHDTIDLGIDGFFITKERQALYLFSQPYLQTKAQLMGLSDSKITSAQVNNGSRIGVEAGTVYKELLTKMYNNVKVIDYQGQQSMLQDLSDHKLDLIMFDSIGATYWVNNSQDVFKLVGEAIPIGTGYGFIANLNKGQLMDRVNKAFNDMENDGTYLSIYSRYF